MRVTRIRSIGLRTMRRYRTGGTPWIVIVEPGGQVVFNDYHLDVDKLIQYWRAELGLKPRRRDPVPVTLSFQRLRAYSRAEINKIPRGTLMSLYALLRSESRRRPQVGLLAALMLFAPLALGQTDSTTAVEEGPLFETPPPVTDAVPLSPQPDAGSLKPGLAVDYLYEKFYTLGGHV